MDWNWKAFIDDFEQLKLRRNFGKEKGEDKIWKFASRDTDNIEFLYNRKTEKHEETKRAIFNFCGAFSSWDKRQRVKLWVAVLQNLILF